MNPHGIEVKPFSFDSDPTYCRSARKRAGVWEFDPEPDGLWPPTEARSRRCNYRQLSPSPAVRRR